MNELSTPYEHPAGVSVYADGKIVYIHPNGEETTLAPGTGTEIPVRQRVALQTEYTNRHRAGEFKNLAQMG